MSAKININVNRFFELYDSDPAMRERLRLAEENYPGSLELREAVVEDVLLPVAAELGYVFTVQDLRIYETMLKNERQKDVERPDGSGQIPEEHYQYWLIDHGWNSDESKLSSEPSGCCGGEDASPCGGM